MKDDKKSKELKSTSYYRRKMVLWYLEARKLRNKLPPDPLTGLKLMQDFEQDCIETMKRVEERKESSSADTLVVDRRKSGNSHYIVFVDVDGLKWTNDHHHEHYNAGNHVLLVLANILKRWKRSDDLVVRQQAGGDEFLILFVESTSEEEVVKRILDMRRRFEKNISDCFPSLVGHVSFTFGLKEVNSRMSAEKIKIAIEEASCDMHDWKKERKTERET
jgi:diguanylate cyclase (GGDEF)-like protein